MTRALLCNVMLATLLLSGCSPADVLNVLTQGDGLEVTRSVAYADGERRTLDVYRKKDAAHLPVVVFFYGGSWQSGSKAIYRFVGAALARSGFVAIVPDYRVYPEVRYPGFVEDGALAVRWAKDNAARFGGDPNRLFLMGHSAGAYIAAMLALDSQWLRAVQLNPGTEIAGLIGISGPYDFLPLREGTLKTIFGGNDPATQPISYVAPGAPPTLLLTGQHDSIVEPSNTERLAARLKASGDAVTMLSYRWVGHLAIIGAFAPPLRFLAPALRDVSAFVENTPAPAARRVESKS
ncbi:MAG TPA: alpha/beta hydrolase [Xanthobacteraceae bacterium]|jgi:acetyl esterase/lipase|nr:alpha/beta hydrolase [Xanthobacteraceae bacterium]